MKTKVCTGPSHAEPTRLPLTQKYFYFAKTGRDKGKPIARCRQCNNWSKLLNTNGPHGYVDAEILRPWIEELVLRCGSPGTANRIHGVSDSTIRAILRYDYSSVQKRTALHLMAALSTQRKLDSKNGRLSKAFFAELKRRAEHDALMETKLEEYWQPRR